MAGGPQLWCLYQDRPAVNGSLPAGRQRGHGGSLVQAAYKPQDDGSGADKPHHHAAPPTPDRSKHIAIETGVSPATVSRVLKRAGLSRIRNIDSASHPIWRTKVRCRALYLLYNFLFKPVPV
ncbi:LacI family DNA-binding transcriptional regulator [Agrobacterium vitis]|nr:LacI family DNA-binding transcriptional regulator [Agrobacterium vitis]MVA19986.1 LacI family DNA-binding transcriptional regulator [Agrobacterium vitis]